jgi:hypothetical protein
VTLWLAGRSVATPLLAACVCGAMAGAGAGTPAGLMLKSVLMAASWCRVPRDETKFPSNPKRNIALEI